MMMGLDDPVIALLLESSRFFGTKTTERVMTTPATNDAKTTQKRPIERFVFVEDPLLDVVVMGDSTSASVVTVTRSLSLGADGVEVIGGVRGIVTANDDGGIQNNEE